MAQTTYEKQNVAANPVTVGTWSTKQIADELIQTWGQIREQAYETIEGQHGSMDNAVAFETLLTALVSRTRVVINMETQTDFWSGPESGRAEGGNTDQ